MNSVGSKPEVRLTRDRIALAIGTLTGLALVTFVLRELRQPLEWGDDWSVDWWGSVDHVPEEIAQ